MKKRVFALLLMAAMSFTLLAACGSKDDVTETPDTTPSASAPADPSFSADLAAFYSEIMAAAESGPFMMDLVADGILNDMYPGLADIETKQLVAHSPAMTAVAAEFVFVEVADAADVEAVKTILQTRIDSTVSNQLNYPQVIDTWMNHAEIVVIDNYVCLFVNAEKDGMVDAFRNGTAVPQWAKLPEAFDEEIMDEEIVDEEIVDEEIVDEEIVDEEIVDEPEVEAEPESAPEASAPAAESKSDTYLNAINNCGAEMVQYNPPFSNNDADMAELVLTMYGLTAEDTESFAASFSMMNVHAYSIVLVQPEAGREQAVVDALTNYTVQKQNEFELYLADQYEVALAAKVETLSDGTVALVMCQGSDDVFQSIKTAVEG